MSSHTVNKVTFLMPANGYEQARQYQHAAQHWAEHTLPGLLNSYFDFINRNGDLLYLEKIEIEIPDFPWKLSDEDWKLKFEKSLLVKQNENDTFLLVVEQWFFYLKNGCFRSDFIFKTTGEIELYIGSSSKHFSESLVQKHVFPLSQEILKRLFFSTQ